MTEPGRPGEPGTPEQDRSGLPATTDPILDASGDDGRDPVAGPMADDASDTPTGDRRVDEAMTTLSGLAGRPAAEQVAGYEAIHRALQDTLATVDDA